MRAGFGERQLSSKDRLISLFEVLLAVFIVLGHNVWRILPNEVPILFVLFFVSQKLRTGRWIGPEFQRPSSWPKTVGIAFAAAAAMQLGSELGIQPIGSHIWHTAQHTSTVFTTHARDWTIALRNLGIVWIFAALGEETGYRAYLLARTADVGNRSGIAYVTALFLAATVFGFAHFYKGPTGVLDSAYSGLVLGSVFLWTRGNLWACILAHGISDTFVVIYLLLT